MRIATFFIGTVAPARNPPSASGPKRNPIINGESMAIAPGNIIFLMDASVDMATHLSYSGLPVPSIIPAMVLNWRRTSYNIAIAASPNARMASDENIKGIIPPINRLASTFAL